MTTTVPDAVRPTGPGTPGPDAVETLVQALTRQVRTLHALKAQVARGQTEAERAMHTVLFVLHDIGPQRVSALAEHLVTDPSTTSRQTAELVKRELLERLPDPDDRRASLLAVTAAGREVVATLRAQRRELLGHAVHDWTDAEVHDLARSLDRFTDGLDRTRSGLAGAARPTSPTTEASPTSQNAQENA